MTARIFKPARGATSSGTARTKSWMLVFDQTAPRGIDPLMGWTSSVDTRQQVRMSFDTREEAVAYCERNGIPYRVEEPKVPKRRLMAYSDNFKYNRVDAWTH
ncbi:MAG: ETC complex I subunit [Salinarimonadaceae bacterium]|nr:MAG: ETC complex I subunit [Salinarimonadaceae bacterium]